MDRPVRIAVIGPVDDRLLGDLRQLPLRPEVRQHTGVVADSEALMRHPPDLLLVAFGADPAEEVGALRLLRQLWPALGLLVVTTPANEVANAKFAQRLGARLFVHPDTPGQLAAAIEQARLGSDRPQPDAFVDLARGIADEINNPLMFASGHLQLLRASFEAKSESDRRDQIGEVMHGLSRIQEAVDRLRRLSQAANGPRRPESVDLAALLAAAMAKHSSAPTSPLPSLAVAEGPHVVAGDREQLEAAVEAIVRFAADLAATGADSRLYLDALPGGRRIRLVAGGAPVANWQLPATFEPYYPSRALRGQCAGLGLFLAQTVVLGHRGQATVQRVSGGALQFDFVLPA